MAICAPHQVQDYLALQLSCITELFEIRRIVRAISLGVPILHATVDEVTLTDTSK